MEIEANQSAEREVLLTNAVVGAMDATVEREYQGHGVLGHGVRRVGRHPRHQDAQAAGGHQIDIIEPGTPQRHMADSTARELLQACSVETVVDKHADSVCPPRRGGCLGCQPKIVEHPVDDIRGRCHHELTVVGLRVVKRDGRHARSSGDTHHDMSVHVPEPAIQESRMRSGRIRSRGRQVAHSRGYR